MVSATKKKWQIYFLVTFDLATGGDRHLLDIAEVLEHVLPPLREPSSI